MEDNEDIPPGCKAYEWSMVVFSYFVGVSWINSLKFCRVFGGMRSFIEIIMQIIISDLVKLFCIVLIVLLTAFSTSQFFIPNKHLFLEDKEGYVQTFGGEVRTQFTIAFGYWGDDERFPFSKSFWTFTTLSCFSIGIVMMNLLIAITTAIYEDTMDNKEKSEYIQLCAVIYDFETLVFDICRDSNEKDEGRHLITAQKETEDQ